MSGVQYHTLQLTWRFCAALERAIGHLQVERQRWTMKDENADMHAWEE